MNMEQNMELSEAMDASILFAKALNSILEEKQGIVVDVPENTKTFEVLKKVVVFKFNDKIHIYKCEDDIEEGTPILLEM